MLFLMLREQFKETTYPVFELHRIPIEKIETVRCNQTHSRVVRSQYLYSVCVFVC